MFLNNITHSDYPFNHWEFSNCLDKDALDEIAYSKIPTGERSYDGTRAADHTGKGIDGKLRLFITKENHKHFPNLTGLIKSLQKSSLVSQISNLIRKDLSILLRQHIDDIIIMSFTELPENKRVKVVATVGEQISTNEKEQSNENANV